MNDKEIDAIIRYSNRYRKDVKVLLEDFDRLATQEQVRKFSVKAVLHAS